MSYLFKVFLPKNTLLIGTILISISIPAVFAQQMKWNQFDTPSLGKVAAIGSYANGCLAGAKALPLIGEGYQVIRTERHRYYGHPQLVAFITNFAKQTQAAGMNDILIGDISMARGGNFESGHSSHQVGLDADIWFRQAEQTLTKDARETPQKLDLVDKLAFNVNQDWQAHHGTMIRLAAESSEVARIFVNPAIKQQLCNMDWQDDSWLTKVRPWWGHSLHMHVRLACPENDALCQNQKAPPTGTGCDELDWWRKQILASNEASKQPKYKSKSKQKSKPKSKNVKVKPEQCQTLYQAE